jgi:hypothetical protein
MKKATVTPAQAALCCLSFVLSCASCRADPLVGDGTMRGFFRELTNPGSLQRSKDAADDTKCRDLGFKPQTDAYGNCRLKLEEIRAIKESGETSRR